ncbi:hypothetical protein JOQ06_010479, partial [Pogonophryne albipinna]
MCSLSLYNPSVTLLNNTDGDKVVVVIASRSLLGKTLSCSHGDHNKKDAVTQEGWVLSDGVNRKDRVQRHSTLPMPSSAESRTQQAVWR